MMTKLIQFLFAISFIAVSLNLQGQITNYSFKRPLNGVDGQWHKVPLPEDIFSKLNNDLSDIRIYGFTDEGDTIEAPYILRRSSGKIVYTDVPFQLVNKSHNSDGYYFTFDLKSDELINQIDLSFGRTNFDWNVSLEGSHNQKEWFSIVNNYRILSIQNDHTDYKFTRVAIPDSRYQFYRLCVKSSENPLFSYAKVSFNQVEGGVYNSVKVKNKEIWDDKERKQTIIDLEFENKVPVALVKIYIGNNFDFYRPVAIRSLTDSIKTEQGWRYNYVTVANGTVSSFENNVFSLPNTMVSRMKLVIENQNNQPLTIDSVEVKGYYHYLIARFQPQATYFLYYGNKQAYKVSYDIERFPENIPDNAGTILLGDEISLRSDEFTQKPSVINELWLWGVMVVIILLLGWLTLGMIKKARD